MKKLVLFLTTTLSVGHVAVAGDALTVISKISYAINAIDTAIPDITKNLEKAQIAHLQANLAKRKEAEEKGDKKAKALATQQAIANLTTLPELVTSLFRFNKSANGTMNKGFISDLVDNFGATNVAIVMNDIAIIIDGLTTILSNVAKGDKAKGDKAKVDKAKVDKAKVASQKINKKTKVSTTDTKISIKKEYL